MQRYDLTVRLEEIKKDQEALLEECRKKKLMLEMLDAPKSASTPPEDNDMIIV